MFLPSKSSLISSREYSGSKRENVANDSTTDNEYVTSSVKKKRIYSSFFEGFNFNDIQRESSMQRPTCNQTIIHSPIFHSESEHSLKFQLHYISQGIHQLDSDTSEVNTDANLAIMPQRRRVGDELGGNELRGSGSDSRSSIFSLSSPLKVFNDHKGDDDFSVQSTSRDQQKFRSGTAHCNSCASLEFQLQFVAPGDPLGTCLVAPFIIFPNMHDPIFNSSSSFVGEEDPKECYGWFVELEKDYLEPQAGFTSFAKGRSLSTSETATPQGYGVATAG